MPEEDAQDRDYKSELQQRDVRQSKFDAIVCDATNDVVRKMTGMKPLLFPECTHLFYGATGIDPKHLAIWYFFETDAEYVEAERTKITLQIKELTHEHLLRHGYPANVLEEIHVGFATDETIKREADGSYYHYFK